MHKDTDHASITVTQWKAPRDCSEHIPQTGVSTALVVRSYEIH